MKVHKFVLGALLLSAVAASAQAVATPRFDVGLTYANTRTGINDKALTYLFGPCFTLRHFARWFGGAHAWSGPNDPQQTQDSVASAAGGG
jgi:hypothetical protein